MPLKEADELLVRKHSFDLKFDSQLADMLVSHQAKLDRLRAPGGDLEKYTTDPDGMGGVRYELKQQFPELSIAELAQEFFDQQVYYIWKDVTLQEIVDTISIEQDARTQGIVDRKPIGTTYYVDGDAGDNSYTGTKISGTIDSVDSTTIFRDSALTGADDYINGSFFYNETTGHKTTIADFATTNEIVTLTDADASMAGTDTYYILHAWLDLDQFTENARSAGDKVICRRGTTVDDGTDLLFTSDGTKVAPIEVTADNANEWHDDVDFSGTATGTPTFGSKAVLMSADATGVISANDVIYVAAESADEFAYEVALSQAADSGADDGADSNKLIDTGKFTNTVIGTQVVNTTDALTGYVSELVSANEVEVTDDGRPSGKGGTIVVFDNGDTFTLANQAVLFLPYKGDQAGSGKTMTNMQGNPIWNSVAGNFQWNFDVDNNWKIQGIHIRGTDSNGNVEIDTSITHEFLDCVFEGNGTGDFGIFATDDVAYVLIRKSRFFNHIDNFKLAAGEGDFDSIAHDSLFDGNAVANSEFVDSPRWGRFKFVDCESRNHGTADIKMSLAVTSADIRVRNCQLNSVTSTAFSASDDIQGRLLLEDDGAPGVSAQHTGLIETTGSPIIESDIGTVRSGGGAISGKFTPSTHLGTIWGHSRQLLFEIPFYATTSSKKYEVFFRPTATSDWTADPTAAELWIEIEYWGDAGFNYRRVLKSTGIIDMTGTDDYTDKLSVTVAPAQAGVAYLRGYYAKTKESAKANTFFWDVVPVVT